MKRKRVGLKIGLVLIFFAAGFASAYLFFGKNKTTENISYHKPPKPDVVLTEEQAQQAIASVASFEELNEASAAKDYVKLISLSKTFGQDTDNQPTQRITAYNMCISAAILTNQMTDKEECYQKAKELVSKLEDEQAKSDLTIVIENTYQNKQIDSSSSEAGR